MSGKPLLKRVLVEKEKALGRKQVINGCLGLAASFTVTALGYSALTYLAAQPALSHNPDEAANLNTAGSNISSLNEPESGVKLILSIFSRLGGYSGTKIAMLQEGGNRWAYQPNVWGAKTKGPRDAESAPQGDQFGQQQNAANEQQFSQGLASNAADPALSIRPQKQRAALDEISYGQAAEKQLAPGQGTLMAQSAPMSHAERSLSAKGSQQQVGWYRSPVRAKIISESPDIREFGQAGKSEAAADLRAKPMTRRQVNIIDEPVGRARMEHSNLIEQSKDAAAASANGDSVTGIIRPSEQPGLFKYVREYYKESLKNMPPPPAMPAAAPVTIPQILEGSPIGSDSKLAEETDSLNNKASRPASTNAVAGGLAGAAAGGGGAGGKGVAASFEMDKDSGRGYNVSNFRANKKKQASPVQIAFLPPNAVHGINGLSLGASAAETTTFLKNHGKFSKVLISGFQIYTLKGERGATVLQAFVRGERLEALRVFSTVFVPPQLGVNLGEELPSMKAKFGEPAFILEEPRSNAKAPSVVAKNYVYPVSQVSFQLSRPNASSTPQVLSMLLFRFL